jgi:hypothetical protein
LSDRFARDIPFWHVSEGEPLVILNLVLISALFLPDLASAGTASPSTIAELFSRLEAAGAKTKAEVLAALPPEMKRNYVLIRDSQSRQQGTPDLPRVLHFSKSADLIASSSGHVPADDFAANDLEVMELDRASGTWRMAMIHFDGQKLSPPAYNPRICLACHGDQPRPLWGEYANWPTAYGGDPKNGVETMGASERGDFLKFLETAKTHEGYRHLELAVTDRSYELPGSVYAYPNTVLTARLGARVAEAIFTRLSRAPGYPKLRLALLGASHRFCPQNAALDARVDELYKARLAADPDFSRRWASHEASLSVTKVLRLLGSDPYADFRLDHLPHLFDPNRPEESVLEWNTGGDTLFSLVAFLVLRDAWQTDPKVRELFALRGPEIERLSGLLSSSNERLLALDAHATSADYIDSLFPYVENRVFGAALGAPNHENLACSYFASPR